MAIRDDPRALTVSKTPGGRVLVGRVNQELAITFKRTVRVADNGQTNALPPDMGVFPVHNASQFATNLPKGVETNGFFFPMYQREAMWINFKSNVPFAIKIYVGGVNVVSGEPALEEVATMLRRLNLIDKKKSIQDYVITPKQLWLDGVASGDGQVRQFVAMPLGTGYSVEYQVTGEDLLGGMQFEITPSKAADVQRTATIRREGAQYYDIYVKTLKGMTLTISVAADETVGHLKELIEKIEGVAPNDQRMLYAGKQLENSQLLGKYPKGITMYMILRLRGGGSPPNEDEMGIAAGGFIKQSIIRDKYDPALWDPEHTTRFNVSILNSSIFKRVTGLNPPACPITAETYRQHGFPYFEIFNEQPSGIVGQFESVKSVNELDKSNSQTEDRVEADKEMDGVANDHIIALDHTGTPIGFRSLHKLVEDVEAFRKMVSPSEDSDSLMKA